MVVSVVPISLRFVAPFVDVPRIFWIHRLHQLGRRSSIVFQQTTNPVSNKLLTSDGVPILHASKSKLLSQLIHGPSSILCDDPITSRFVDEFVYVPRMFWIHR